MLSDLQKSRNEVKCEIKFDTSSLLSINTGIDSAPYRSAVPHTLCQLRDA